MDRHFICLLIQVRQEKMVKRIVQVWEEIMVKRYKKKLHLLTIISCQTWIII